MASKVKSDLIKVLPQLYQDATEIPEYAKDEVAIATRTGLVVNYLNVKIFNPNLAATRADVAVSIYQALVYLEEVPQIQCSNLAGTTRRRCLVCFTIRALELLADRNSG